MPVTGITKASIVKYGTTDIPVEDISFRTNPRIAHLKHGQGGYLQLTGTYGYGTVSTILDTSADPGEQGGAVYTPDDDSGKLVYWSGTEFVAITAETTFVPGDGYRRIWVPEDLSVASEMIAQALPSVLAGGSMRDVMSLQSAGPIGPRHPLIPDQAERLLRKYR